ncbi:MAG: DUF4097 family beta strand repeat protein [Chloroflexi bacterium]|nr:DUF4097 family beta strand repeat protein [Chloroflexota bacterium]
MARFRGVLLTGLALLVVAGLWGLPQLGKLLGEDIGGETQAVEGRTESFALDGPATLRFVDLNGSVSFARAEKEEDRQKITIIFTRKAKGGDQNQAKAELEKVAVEFKPTKGGIDVISRTGGGLLKKPSANKQVDFRIVAPEGVGVTVANGRGSVALKGVQGDVKLEGPSLAVDLNDVRGDVFVRTDRGDIRVANSLGQARVETREGSVTLSKVSGAALEATGSKDISIKDGGAESDLRALSQAGNVSVDRSRGKTVVVEANAGRIAMSDTTAEESLTATARNGAMSFRRVNAARFQAATESGDLSLADVQGGLDLKTGKGSVNISRATASSLKISGTGGATFSGQLPASGESSIQIAAGNITIYVGKESAFRLDARTSSGKVTVDDRLQMDTQDRPGSSRIQGVANGGTAKLGLSTGAGDIRISNNSPPVY